MKQRFFSPWNNFKNSMRGLIEVTRNEAPLKVEWFALILMTISLFFLHKIPLFYKMLLFTSLWIPILVEILNSAIERTVDLVTLEYHELAKHAKDAASAAVMIALIITGLVWFSVLFYFYG